MQLPEDYSPIVAEGAFEAVGRRWNRRRRMADVEPVPPGCVRVFVDGDGRIIAAGTPLSAGEKYWLSSGGWVTIDCSDHDLRYSFPVQDPSGQASYIVAVTVRARVVDAAAAAERRARTVRSIIEPTLREAVAVAMRDMSEPAHASDPVAALTAARTYLENHLRASLLGTLATESAAWLGVNPTSVTVSFDAETERHVRKLVEELRSGQLLDATALNREKDAAHVIDLRNKWREHLSQHLSNPAMRAVEVVVGDPTPENIQRAVHQLDQSDREHREWNLTVLRSLLDGHYIEDIADLTALRAVVTALENAPPPPAPELEAPARPEVVEAEAHTGEHPVVNEEDTVWSAD